MNPLRLLAALVLLLAAAARGDDAFYRIPLGGLTIAGGTIPTPDPNSSRRWRMSEFMHPYAVLDGPGEVYAATEQDLTDPLRPRYSETPGDAELFIRAPQGQPIAGTVVLPNADWSGMVPLRFTIPAATATPDARRDFYRAKESHYSSLQNQNIPGSAWFRRQSTEAYRALLADDPQRAAAIPPRSVVSCATKPMIGGPASRPR